MVTFNKNKNEMCNNLDESYTITVMGDKWEYIDTIKAILTILAYHNSDIEFTQNELYYLCNLVSCMLPDGEQVISMEDVELLKRIKEKGYENTNTNV